MASPPLWLPLETNATSRTLLGGKGASLARLAAAGLPVPDGCVFAAIVACELGIPAVVGTGTATQRVRTGDRLRVDGGRGSVELL